MRMSAPLPAPVVLRHVTTHWAASSVPVPLDSTSSSSPTVARMWTSAPPSKTPAAMAAPTPKEATSAAVLLDTIGSAKGEKGMWYAKYAKGIWAHGDITRLVRYSMHIGKC